MKIGAIGSIFALRFALVRRNKPGHGSTEPEAAQAAVPVRRDPHPVSKKKKKRRRRRPA